MKQDLLEQYRYFLKDSVRLVIDFSKIDLSNIKLLANKHFEILEKTDDGILGSVVGPDPYMSFPFPSSTHHLLYEKAVLICEFLELEAPVNKDLQSDVFQFYWGSDGMNPENIHVINQKIILEPGRLRFEVDLKQDEYWLILEKIDFFRFDFGTKYRGKLKIYYVFLE